MQIRQTQSEAPLAALRVLDLGHFVAGPLAAMLLADQGAQVLHVDNPHKDATTDPVDAVLQRNKSRESIDLKGESGRSRLSALIAEADVVIENYRPGVMDRLGFGYKECSRLRPDIVYLSMPGFPSSDVDMHQKQGWEGIVGAASGLFSNISFTRDFLGLPPVYTALPLPSVYAAVHGVTAVMMALLARSRTGKGEFIEVSMAGAFMSAMGANALAYTVQPERYDLPPVSRAFKETQLPVLKAKFAQLGEAGVGAALDMAAALTPPMMATYVCADDKLVYVFAMDHRRMSIRLLQELGIYDQFKSELEERDPYAPTSIPNNIADVGTLGKDLKDRLKSAMAGAFRGKTARQWEEQLSAAGVPCAMHRTTAEWISEPHVIQSSLAVTVHDPVHGDMLQPGPAVWLSDAPQHLLRPKSRASNPSKGHFSWTNTPPLLAVNAPHASKAGCLAGLRVIDLSTMIAGPACARTLAEYGADVVKVDPVEPYLGPRMSIWYSPELNQGKSSILLDLKSEAGRQAFLKLVENADVVVHNMRPGVLDRLGLSLDELRARQPAIVLTSITAFQGPSRGMWDEWPGFDPVVQAASGVATRFGTAAKPEIHAIASTIDYLTGFLAAFGTALSLFGRRSNSPASEVRTSLSQASMLAQLPYAFTYEGRQWDEPQGQLATGSSSASRIYKTLDGWIFLHAAPESVSALRRLGAVDASASDEVLGSALEHALSTQGSKTALAVLAQAGVSAQEIRTLAEIAAESGEDRDTFLTSSEHPETFCVLSQPHAGTGGTVRTIAPLYARLQTNPLRLCAASEPHGASTANVLGTLGLNSGDIEDLLRQRGAAVQLSSVFLPS